MLSVILVLDLFLRYQNFRLFQKNKNLIQVKPKCLIFGEGNHMASTKKTEIYK